jgi:hypothetical protein
MSLNDEIEININNEDRKSIFTSTKEEINPIVVQLQNLGYNKVYSRRVFYYLHPEDLEEALNYMAIENGIIQHRYIQGRYISNNICYICGEERKKHLNELNNENIKNNNFNNNRIYINEINNRQIENNDFNNEMKVNELNEFQDDLGNFSCNNKNKETIFPKNIFKFKYNKNKIDNKPFIINNTLDNLIPEEEEKECEICNEIFIVNENNKVEKCGHSFCPGCWYDFLSVKIKENKLPSIKCLDYNCKEKLTDEFIINLLNSDTKLVRKYKKYKLELEIINDPNKKLCPYPNCNSYLEIIDIRDKDVTCYNLHSFCFECLKKPHGKLPCGENIDKNLIEYAKNNFVKKCPKCSIIIEKNGGCNHITCTKCGYQWCWLCKNECNLNHFKEGKCKGFQFFQPKNEYEIKLMMEGKINVDELSNNQKQYNDPSGISVDNSQISEQEEIEIDEEQNNFNIGSCAKAIILIFFYLFFGNLYFIIKAFEVHRYIQLITYLLFYISFFFHLIVLNTITFILFFICSGFKNIFKIDYNTYIKRIILIIIHILFSQFFLNFFLWDKIINYISFNIPMRNIKKSILFIPYALFTIIIFLFKVLYLIFLS